MNNVVLMGRLVKDPEVRVTQNQTSVVSLTLAVDRNMTKEKKEQAMAKNQPTADFIRCMAFGRMADTIGRYFSKGNRMLISGRINTGKYQNRDGQTVYTTDVVIERFDFVESMQQNGGQQNRNNYQQNYQQPDDDLPEGFMMIDETDVPF